MTQSPDPLLQLPPDCLHGALRLISYMLGEARSATDADDVLTRMAGLIRAGGVPLDRATSIVPLLHGALERSQTDEVVDLCAGGSGPWLRLEQEYRDATGAPLSVTLTDRYPNLEAMRFARQHSDDRLAFHPEPVDAMDVPPSLGGLRTLFNAFHHFRPDQARALLQDAADKGRGVAIFDGTDKRLLGVLMVMFAPLGVLFLTPLIRPFKLSRLFFTYLLPLIPFVVWFDGIVSVLRTYSVPELEALVAGVQGDHQWQAGALPIGGGVNITYLIGTPR